MVEGPSRFDYWDKGFKAHKKLAGNFPCIVGWEKKHSEPKDSRGFYDASSEALARWRADSWSTGIRYFEDVHRAWKMDGSESRTVSPAECERLLGFPVSWTTPGAELSDTTTADKRRNAVGNAFAVPVIFRILAALMLVVNIPTAALERMPRN